MSLLRLSKFHYVKLWYAPVNMGMEFVMFNSFGHKLLLYKPLVKTLNLYYVLNQLELHSVFSVDDYQRFVDQYHEA